MRVQIAGAHPTLCTREDIVCAAKWVSDPSCAHARPRSVECGANRVEPGHAVDPGAGRNR